MMKIVQVCAVVPTGMAINMYNNNQQSNMERGLLSDQPQLTSVNGIPVEGSQPAPKYSNKFKMLAALGGIAVVGATAGVATAVTGSESSSSQSTTPLEPGATYAPTLNPTVDGYTRPPTNPPTPAPPTMPPTPPTPAPPTFEPTLNPTGMPTSYDPCTEDQQGWCDFYQIPALEEDRSCTESWQTCDNWNRWCEDDCFSTLCNGSKRNVCQDKMCDAFCTFHTGEERRDDCANLPEIEFCDKYEINSFCASNKSEMCNQGKCDRYCESPRFEDMMTRSPTPPTPVPTLAPTVDVSQSPTPLEDPCILDQQGFCDFMAIPAMEINQACTESWQSCDNWNRYCQDDCFGTLCASGLQRAVCQDDICQEFCRYHHPEERREDCAELGQVEFCEKYGIPSNFCATNKSNMCTQGQCDRYCEAPMFDMDYTRSPTPPTPVPTQKPTVEISQSPTMMEDPCILQQDEFCEYMSTPAQEENQSCAETWQSCDNWNRYCQDDCTGNLCGSALPRYVCQDKICDSFCDASGAQRRADCGSLSERDFCKKYDMGDSFCASRKNDMCNQGICDRYCEAPIFQ